MGGRGWKGEDVKTIAIDYDGCIVKDGACPDGGELMPGAVDAIKRLARAYTLILWTCREGPALSTAMAMCKQHRLPFSAVNTCEGLTPSRPSVSRNNTISRTMKQRTGKNWEVWTYRPRKIGADVYIDDKNLGGFPGWDAVVRDLT